MLAGNTERVSQDRMGGDRQRTQRAREVGREGLQDTRKARISSLDAAAGGAESRAVRNKSWHSSVYEGRTSALHAKEKLPPQGLPGGRSCTDCCEYSRHAIGTRDAAQNWEEKLAPTVSKLKTDEWNRVHMRVARCQSEANTSWHQCKVMTSLSVEIDQPWNSSSK